MSDSSHQIFQNTTHPKSNTVIFISNDFSIFFCYQTVVATALKIVKFLTILMILFRNIKPWLGDIVVIINFVLVSRNGTNRDAARELPLTCNYTNVLLSLHLIGSTGRYNWNDGFLTKRDWVIGCIFQNHVVGGVGGYEWFLWTTDVVGIVVVDLVVGVVDDGVVVVVDDDDYE